MAAAKTTPKRLDEARAELRRPFTANAIKMKPQATSGEGDAMKGLVTYYVDSRLVVERLNEVVGPEAWWDTYKLLADEAVHAPALGIPVECSLTVLGITKVDVGQIAPGTVDDKAWKSAYSDAFKRAAVKFGVGAYLYGGASVWAPVKVGRNGKAQGFTDSGAKFARDRYADWIALPRMTAMFGEPLDHGDVDLETVEADPDPSPFQPPVNGNGKKPTATELKKLVEIVDELIAGEHITLEAVTKSAGGDWPAVAETLDKAVCLDLTKRLTTFKGNIAKAAESRA